MDSAQYTYPSPLASFPSPPALPTGTAADGKSLLNPPSTTLSHAYTSFPPPITNGPRGGFDIHIYHNSSSPSQVTFARELHTRIRLEFPELRIYRFWDKPVGPHTMAMFEVNVFTPAQFGAFVSWLVINRGPLSALVHPNTEDELRDHTQRATWLGEKVMVDTGVFWEMKRREVG
ncbi:DOPA-like domain-containing protein [Trichophaea hybrida]|nr:DOPA-like domain-containing protein [Trichophaea hybrida]